MANVGEEPHRRVTCIVVGAGERGTVYSKFASAFPDRMQVVGVAEPRTHFRERMQQAHSIAPEHVLAGWEEVVALGKKVADFAVIATQDRDHRAPAVALAGLGYHLLLEKPMAVTEADCIAIRDACSANNVKLCVCHVLRYSPVNKEIKRLITSGAIGDVVNIQHMEPVGFWHFAHSFVRGNWRREDESAPALLAKSCHDIDLLRYWMGLPCLKVSSFGSLNHFRPDKKPAGGALRCMDCPAAVENSCPYSAKKIYLESVAAGNVNWPNSVVTEIPDIESITTALKEGPYGRCAYECDNDVVDNQVVNMEFEGGRTASFSMIAFTEKLCVRQTTIFGTKGQLTCNDSQFVKQFDFLNKTTIDHDCAQVATEGQQYGMGGHGGADYHLMNNWVSAVATGDWSKVGTTADDALASHLLVFAAEDARKGGSVINLEGNF